MSIDHHPDEMLLTGYAAGTLSLGYHVAVATHLQSCAFCRAEVRMMTDLGGVLLDELPPVSMSEGAFAALATRLDHAEKPRSAPARETLTETGLPAFVRHYAVKDWRVVAPGLAMRPIQLPQESSARIFLLKSAPNMELRHHTHSGVELTCVLRGGFTHEGGHYGPGDFDFGDSDVNHTPRVDPGEACVCLVAMEGRLQLKGWIGALISPFIRL